MTEETKIPVCTLFNENEDATTGDGNFFNNPSPSTSVKKDEANMEDKPIESSNNVPSKQPVVCDLFKSVPSEEDLFSGLSNPNMLTTNNSSQVFIEKDDFNETNTSPVEVSEKSDLSEPSLPRNDLSEIFHTVVEDTKDEGGSEPNEDCDKEVPNNTFDANSDMMASLLINDDSFDNISSICMEENSKLGTPDTEMTNTNITIESESFDEVESTSEKSSDLILIKEPSSSDVSSGKVEMSSPTVSTTVLEPIIPYTTSAFYAAKDKDVKHDDNNTEIPSSHSDEELEKSELQVASTLFGQLNTSSPFDTIEKASSLDQDEDAFTNALHTSEVDRRRDAWIPSDSTRVVLSAVVQSQKRISLEPNHLTRPGLATSESLGDPVKAVIARHKGLEGATERKTLSASSVSCDKAGLHQLIISGNFRAAVDLCGMALANLGQGFGRATQESVNSSTTLQWWQTRFSLLLHLKLYDLAIAELEQFQSFDTPDLYYEFYPDLHPGRRGSMVPFSLRLLNADFPRHLNKPTESLSRLYSLQHVCTKVISNLDAGKAEDGNGMRLKDEDRDASLELWTQRRVKVRYCIGNTLLQLREYNSAVKVFDNIIEDRPGDAVALLSGVGRALLQLGDIKAAQQRFAQAERLAGSEPWHKVQLVSNRGFLYLGANNWKEALNQFDEALKTDPTNIEALNNKAVCLLYLSRLREAITVQEKAARLKEEATQPRSRPNDIPFEGALSNLVTLYELESAQSMMKKQNLLSHIAAKSGDGFNVACLKM